MSRFRRDVVSKVSLKPVEPPAPAAPPKPTKGVLVPKNSAKPPKPTKGKKNASVMQESSLSKSLRENASDFAADYKLGRVASHVGQISRNPLVEPEDRAMWRDGVADLKEEIKG